MMNATQIQNLLGKSIEELKDISNIPNLIPASELPAEIDARRRMVQILEKILFISEHDERSFDKKDKLFYLPEHEKN